MLGESRRQKRSKRICYSVILRDEKKSEAGECGRENWGEERGSYSTIDNTMFHEPHRASARLSKVGGERKLPQSCSCKAPPDPPPSWSRKPTTYFCDKTLGSACTSTHWANLGRNWWMCWSWKRCMGRPPDTPPPHLVPCSAPSASRGTSNLYIDGGSGMTLQVPSDAPKRGSAGF